MSKTRLSSLAQRMRTGAHRLENERIPQDDN
jgi:hypothetical protein